MHHCLIKDNAIKELRGVRAKWLMPTQEAVSPMPFRIQYVPIHKKFPLVQLPGSTHPFFKGLTEVLWKWIQAVTIKSSLL